MTSSLLAFAAAAGAATPAADQAVAISWQAVYVAAVTALSWVLMLSGSFFVLVGSIGLVRMPDTFTRMHAASVIDTLGAGLLIGGMMLQAGASLITLKLLFIFILFLVTSPVATHALAQAALHAGERPELMADRTIGAAPPRDPADTTTER